MKSAIMPYMARIISSNALRRLTLFLAETRCKFRSEWPAIEVFLHPKDPYSQLLLQVLPQLQSRFATKFKIYWLDVLEADMFPEPELLHRYAQKDCEYLAKQYRLKAPVECQIDAKHQHQVSCMLQAIADDKTHSLAQIVELSLTILHGYATAQPASSMHTIVSNDQIAANHRRLKKQGHYGPGVVYFAGEWYWGLDRLHHLENRLNSLGLNLTASEIVFDQHLKLPALSPGEALKDKTLTLYWSARSPYSYLALLRCCDLAKQYQFNLDVKPVMPMVMRNLPVPKAKKMYIFKDTKREANRLGIDYGFVADPLGEAVIRCYSLLDYSRQQNRHLDFLLSFSKAVNAEGIRAETDKGLKFIVERAGLSWPEAQLHLNNESWQIETQANLQKMTDKGLWGVPSIEFENEMIWGQDRIPYIMQSMIKSGN